MQYPDLITFFERPWSGAKVTALRPEEASFLPATLLKFVLKLC